MVAKKRLLAGLASLTVMGIALAGCGPSTNNSSNTPKDEKVTITYMHRLPDKKGMTLVNDIVAKWNKDNPNIQVKATKFDGAAQDMIKKLATDVKAGAAPDLAQVGYAELPEVFSQGLLQDVTEEAAKYKDHFAEGPFSMMQIGGKAYGLPQDTGPLTYFYNAKEFEKLGITVPKTADELIATAKKTAAQGKYIMTFQPDEGMMTMSGTSGASGAWYKTEGNAWKVDTQTAGSKAVAKVYQQLLDDKSALTNPRWDPSFDASINKGQLIGTVGSPAVHQLRRWHRQGGVEGRPAARLVRQRHQDRLRRWFRRGCAQGLEAPGRGHEVPRLVQHPGSGSGLPGSGRGRHH